MTNDLWLNSSIQFPRLLSEIVATCDLSTTELCESMDITPSELDELLDRAIHLWELQKIRNTNIEIVGIDCPWCESQLYYSAIDEHDNSYMECRDGCHKEYCIDTNGIMVDIT